MGKCSVSASRVTIFVQAYLVEVVDDGAVDVYVG